MQRRYPSSPIAAVAAVLLEGESVLLVKRGNPPNPATWGLPGGAVELGETVRQALQREIKEETGLEIEPISLVAVFDSIHPNGHGQVEYHYVLVEYLCRVVSGVLSPASDIVEARWVQLSQMNLVGIGPATARLILKAADENKVNRTSNSRWDCWNRLSTNLQVQFSVKRTHQLVRRVRSSTDVPSEELFRARTL